jgi:arylsulfatase A-like enzyme
MNRREQPNIVCLAIDRLHAGYMGAYGNTWIQTPALDGLAAESLVFDRAIIDSPRLELLYRSLWQGWHALCPEDRASSSESLAAQFSRAGWHTALLTDEKSVAVHPSAVGFTEKLMIDSSGDAPRNAGRRVAASIEETDAAAFFAQSVGWLESAQSPFFLWLHTGTLGRTWDAPLEFREQYTDEDDPMPGDWADVPNRLLPERFDPDELTAITHAYAGQVSLIDQLIGSLLTSLEETGLADNTLFVCFSPRGISLGEHRRIGVCDDALYAELTHVPFLLRPHKGFSNTGRTQALVQPTDLPATILDICGLALHPPSVAAKQLVGQGKSLLPLIQGQPATGFDRACIVAPNQQHGIVTPAWSLRVHQRSASSASDRESSTPIEAAELFAKPDDWFEVNEVSNRCPGLVEKLQAAYQEFSAAAVTGLPTPLADLPEELIEGID